MTFAQIVLVSVGNTRTRIAPVVAGALQPSRVVVNADADGAAGLANRVKDATSGDISATVMVASVNEAVAEPLCDALRADGRRVIRVTSGGSGLSVPIKSDVEVPAKVGVDRLLAALGAYSRSSQACVVIDAGTAVTVDFVDEKGTFRGGAIAPGLAMMLRSMHEHTAALPLIELKEGQPLATGTGPLGKNTQHAMALGCIAALQGMTHVLIEQYAEVAGGYPRVVATGGDAARIFEHDDLVEHIVPDLVLVGMHAAFDSTAATSA